MFIATLFTVARTWKWPRCPSTDEWIKKWWYMYTMEYYSAIKMNEFESVPVKWINLEPRVKKVRKRKTSYINACIWNLEKWYWWTYLQGRNRDSDIQNTLMDIAREGEKMQLLSHAWLFVAPWTIAHQASLSMDRLPFPTPGELPHPGIKLLSLTSPALAGKFFTTSATWFSNKGLRGQRGWGELRE